MRLGLRVSAVPIVTQESQCASSWTSWTASFLIPALPKAKGHTLVRCEEVTAIPLALFWGWSTFLSPHSASWGLAACEILNVHPPGATHLPCSSLTRVCRASLPLAPSVLFAVFTFLDQIFPSLPVTAEQASWASFLQLDWTHYPPNFL